MPFKNKFTVLQACFIYDRKVFSGKMQMNEVWYIKKVHWEQCRSCKHTKNPPSEKVIFVIAEILESILKLINILQALVLIYFAVQADGKEEGGASCFTLTCSFVYTGRLSSLRWLILTPEVCWLSHYIQNE